VTEATQRQEVVRKIREALVELGAEGVEYIAAPPHTLHRSSSDTPAAGAQQTRATREPPSPGFTPRVAPLAQTRALSSSAGERASALQAVRQEIGDCQRCPLCEKRRNIVFGEGSPEAAVVFVGEGPGDEEDRSGRPFVGRSGELLTKMIEAVGWRREDIYICNIVKCRPPGNRNPELEEVAACRPFLDKQILAIQPRVIVTLGKPAISTLLGRNVAITRERGNWQEWNGIAVMPTFHPAYLLRSYTQKNRQAVWDDLRAVRARVDEADSS
jgi:DNA polymerase